MRVEGSRLCSLQNSRIPTTEYSMPSGEVTTRVFLLPRLAALLETLFLARVSALCSLPLFARLIFFFASSVCFLPVCALLIVRFASALRLLPRLTSLKCSRRSKESFLPRLRVLPRRD